MGQVKAPFELGAGLPALPGAAQRRAVVGEGAGQLDRGPRSFEDLHGLGQQRQPAVAALD